MAGGKERAQGRSGRASAERAGRETYWVEVDLGYLARIERVRINSERPLHRDVQVPRSTGIVRERPSEKPGLSAQ